MDISNLHKVVVRTRRTFNWGLVIESVLRYLAVWIYAVAVFQLIVKVWGRPLFLRPLVLVISALIVVGVGMVMALRKRYSYEQVAAWLDLKCEGGGRFLSEEKEEGITVKTSPQLKLSFSYIGRQIAIPLLLVIGVWLVPAGTKTMPVSGLAILARANDVSEHIQDALKVGAIDKNEEAVLMNNLKRAKESMTSAPEASVEAIDQVQKLLDRRIIENAKHHLYRHTQAKRLSQNVISSMTKKERGELINSLRDALDGLRDDPRMSKDLNDLLNKLAQSGNGGNDLIAAASKNLSKADAETLKQLIELLEQHHGMSLSQIAQASGVLSSEQAKSYLDKLVASASQSGGEGLPENKQFGESSGENGIGQGSPVRGQGDAPLTFGDEPVATGTKFNPIALSSSKDGMPGLGLGRSTRATADTIPPAEFRPPQRTGNGLEGNERGYSTGLVLGPYQQRVTERYFSEERNE